MKYYWIALTIEIKIQATKTTLCACKMKGEGNMLLNNVNVGKEFLPIQKFANNRRYLTFDNLRKMVVVYCNNTFKYHATMLNKVRFLMGALS